VLLPQPALVRVKEAVSFFWPVKMMGITAQIPVKILGTFQVPEPA
jgi:hypothetical protein